MPSETPSEDPRWVFQSMLNLAIVGGQLPSVGTTLGAQTRTAIDSVARAHPDATADEIAIAYDAFEREHGQRLTTE